MKTAMNEVGLIFGSAAHMAEVASGAAALVLTSPPYFPDEIEARLRKGSLPASEVDGFERRIRDFAISLRPVFEECARVLHQDGAIVIQTRDVRLDDRLVAVEGIHRTLVEALGFVLYARYVWRPKHTTLPRSRQLRAARARGAPRPFDPEVFLALKRPGTRHRGSPLEEDTRLLGADLAKTSVGRLPESHPFQSPIPMLEAIIRSFTRKGDLVVDPFAGGATTLVVARRLSRRSIGYEISPEAFNLAERNIEAAQ